MMKFAGAAIALIALSGVANADWSVRPDSGWIVEAPTAFGPAQTRQASLGITCFDGRTPIFVLTTGQSEGPEMGSVTLSIDGRSYTAEARREDDKWIGEPSPVLIAALVRGLVLDVRAPGAQPAVISLRGSARAIGDAMGTCGG